MSKLIITGDLKTRTALHLGGGSATTKFDALLRRTAGGRIFIPGSALAGSLRALATRLAPRLGSKVCKALEADPDPNNICGCLTCRLFGELYPQAADEESEGGRASRLWVSDAHLKTGGDTWIRDGVGINRTTGAAARAGSVKFDLEVLPAGVVFGLRLALEEASVEEERLLAAVLAEWRAGRGTVGGRVSRGLGALALVEESLTFEERRLDEPEVLMRFLRGAEEAGLTPANEGQTGWLAARLAETQIEAAPDNPHVARGWVELVLTLRATGPLIVNDPTRAQLAGFDHAPLVEEGRPVLPGSSLKGVLRSQAEKIARTLATEDAANGKDFLRRCPACSPVARPRSDTEETGTALPLESCDTLLEVPGDQPVTEDQLCLACRLFGSPRLGSRLIMEDAPLLEGRDPDYKVQDFLAIDRFTGGGREGAKFDAATLWQPAFTVRIRLENPCSWELGWLALVLRDLAEGWLTVGFGAAKGFGRVVVPRWEARVGYLQPADLPVTVDVLAEALGGVAASGSLYRVLGLEGQVAPPEQRSHAWRWSLIGRDDGARWAEQVQAWVRAFHDEVAGFDARLEGRLPALSKDSYFGEKVEELYPRAGAALKEVVSHG